MNKIVKIIVGIPWVPYKMVVILSAIYQILKHNDVHEIILSDVDDLKKNKGLLEFFESMTPPEWIQYTVAVIFYLYITLKIKANL